MHYLGGGGLVTATCDYIHMSSSYFWQYEICMRSLFDSVLCILPCVCAK